MRKNVFSIFLIVVCSAIMLFSCQNDEVEMNSLSKIELLKAKSKEFAKKYGVDVTLNEDSLAKYADRMTVESMEADYRAFAEMKNVQAKGDLSQASVKDNSLSKKKFIRRRKIETETMTPDMFDNEGEISSEGSLFKTCCGAIVTYEASAAWKSDSGSIKVKLNNVTLYCSGGSCGEVDDNGRPKCTNCSGSYGNGYDSWINVYSGTVTRDGAYFSVSTKIGPINLCAYTFSDIPVEISCSGKSGYVRVGL